MATTQSHAGVELLEQLGKAGDGKSPLGCMQCGLCGGSCPLGDAMEFPPRKMILQASAGNLDEVLASPSLWMCVGCYTCSQRCPRAIELTDGLWPALRDKAMQQGIPAARRAAGDASRTSSSTATRWASRRGSGWTGPRTWTCAVLDLSKEPRPVEVLWLVGCYPSYYPRNRVVTRAFARILTAAGRHAGACWATRRRRSANATGCSARRGSSRRWSSRTGSCWTSSEFEKIVVLDPHGYRALEKFYPALRREVSGRALHAPSWPSGWSNSSRCWSSRSRRRSPTTTTAALGRRYGCFDPPRALLEAIPGREAGGDGPQPRQRPVLRRRGRRHVAGRPHRRPRRPAALRPSASARRPTPGPTCWPSPAPSSCRASRIPPRSPAWRAGSRSATSSSCWPSRWIWVKGDAHEHCRGRPAGAGPDRAAGDRRLGKGGRPRARHLSWSTSPTISPWSRRC